MFDNRREIMQDVFLTYLPAQRFKTSRMTVQLIAPLQRETAAANALLPAVLRRGTVRCPDMESLSAALDTLYGANVDYTVRKKGERQCVGFAAGFIDDAFTPHGEKLLEPVSAMLGELLLDPVTHGGRFLSSYVESEKANLILSNPFCILRTIGSGGSVKYTRYFSPEKLDEYFTPTHRPDSSAVNLEGRNVMVFILESMSAEHSAYLKPELYGNGTQPGYTPFLDSLMRQSLCFGQMYANGTRSIQAMPAVLGSIPSFKQPFVLMPQSLGKSRQLPQILRDKGYRTAFFCGSERGSMGFGAYARSAGIDRLLSREDYEAAHGTEDFDGYWGIWDEPFLQFTGEELSKMQEPFFATLFTLSSHHPFVVPEQYADKLPAGTTKIHKPVAYEDLAFRNFYRRFKDEEWFRRTIFVFVADHVSSEKMAEETRSYPGNYHIVGFIHTPDGALAPQFLAQTVQQIDIMPTLLGLLGNREPYFAFGRDILNEPDREPWAVMYDSEFRVVTDEALFSFDEEWMTGATFRNETSDREQTASVENRLKALIQQYYGHVEAKNYTVEDNL